MYIYSFENLEVWKLSRELVKRIYKLTNKFPVEEKYGIITQIRRSSISVSSNLAEGNSRKSKKDQARFTEISYGSLLESLNLLILSVDLEFIKEKELLELRILIDEIGNKLNALKNAQLKNT